MIIYSIPEMTMENEWTSLAALGRYVDGLVERTSDLDYAIVFEWDKRGPGDWSPVAVLARLDGRWWRRKLLITDKLSRKGARIYDAEPYGRNVNVH